MMFSVVRRPEKCAPDKPWIACEGRRDAQLNNEMGWDSEMRCYVLYSAPRRTISWRTKYFNPSMDSTRDGERYRIVDCPFCGQTLPDLQAIADATCNNGEDGG